MLDIMKVLIYHIYMGTTLPTENQNQQQNSVIVNVSQTNKLPNASFPQKFFIHAKTLIFEAFLIVFFSLLILLAFNYFNLIPLSDINPVFYALPRLQSRSNSFISGAASDDSTFFNSGFPNLSACNPLVEDNIIINSLVSCTSPVVYKNTGFKVTYNGVSTPIAPDQNKPLQINFAVKLVFGNDYNYKSGNDGIILGGDQAENRIFILYNYATQTWGVFFIYGEKLTQFQPIYTVTAGTTQRAFFSLLISPDGKQISLISPNGLLQTFTSQGSLYSKDGTISTSAVVAPNSEVDVYSLNYLPSP